MPVQAKICGISSPQALDAALVEGASHVGFVFFAKSPRNVTLAQAASLAARVPHHVKSVGLFVDPSSDVLDRILAQVPLDIIQLHGDETPDAVARIAAAYRRDVWKAIPVRTAADRDTGARYAGAAALILYDAKPPAGAELPGGNGIRFDWTLLRDHRPVLPWALSGGLDPDNVAEAIRTTGAPLVDVSSGVESAPGIKDVDKIAAFLQATRL